MKMRRSMGCDDWRGDWARERIFAQRAEREKQRRRATIEIRLKGAVLPPEVEARLREARDAD